MTKTEEHKGITWERKSRISECKFKGYDFTHTDFNQAIFENVYFFECVFEKSNLDGSKLFFNSNFKNCVFRYVDLSHTTFGSNKGTYDGCLFEKCKFSGQLFNYTRFIDCLFKKCKLNNISFNASSFLNCKFIGSLYDVTFNGLYDINKSEYKSLESVDFSEAKLGDFVTFIDCDLSSCVPPKDSSFSQLLYNIDSNDARVLSTGSKDRIVVREKDKLT